MLTVAVAAALAVQGCTSSSPQSTPASPASTNIPVKFSELPVPPTVPADGICASPTGCVSANWGGLGSPGFYWDPHYVLLGITYAGAPAAPSPASVYNGPQVIVVRTDGTTFADGNAWKCITCGVAFGADIDPTQFPYPPAHELPDGRHVLVGNGILECGQNGADYAVTDPRCTPANTRIAPIYWGTKPLRGLTGREWRLSPDGVHLAWDTLDLATFSEVPFAGRLTYDKANKRYDLVNVSALYNPSDTRYAPYVVGPGNKLTFNSAGMVGELRGWNNDGTATLGIQAYESDSVDAWETSLATGKSRALTDHAEYTDPMSMSPDGRWLLAEEVIGSGRLDFISGMEGIPPITDQLSTIGYVSGIRNNGNRRFFLPWLVGTDGKVHQQINKGADAAWNTAADPAWLADSTAVVYTENLACGANPTPHKCPDSTEPGGRNSRTMIARFPTLPASKAVAPPVTSDRTWGLPATQGQQLPPPTPLPAGTYTVDGKVSGSASVVITHNAADTAIASIDVTFRDVVDKPGYVLNGTEKVSIVGTTPLNEVVTWNANITLSGQHTGSKSTSPGGFTLGPDLLLQNKFLPTGTMTTVLDGRTYTQPASGA
ncbi:hypothetical protein [Pseudofrankia inefficax]|uniref:hypothetical protein n=1 Tax=Pseudofrankia inefficax (strain DSM 45817 / CECT 9037 / DDB 130130 / EuI1c) TaxID=298654 RepID=UPI0003160A6E|nr:hypothetical protein [Pseudofrankia inefficax]